MFEVILQLKTNLIFINLLVQDVVSVADLLRWFLGLLDLPPELRDVLLKRTESSCSVKKTTTFVLYLCVTVNTGYARGSFASISKPYTSF